MLIVIFILPLSLPLTGPGKAHVKCILEKGHKLAILVWSEAVGTKKLDALQEKKKELSDKFIAVSDKFKDGVVEPA